MIDRSTDRDDSFRLGINYWPARTAMGWWTDFDSTEVGADFLRIAAGGFDSVRLFLTWEDFQPDPHIVETQMLTRLVIVADLALEAGLTIMPTLFTGHMSGVNWVPRWALGGSEMDSRFRVSSGGKLSSSGLRSWYADDDILTAQVLMAARAAEVLAGHQAMWAWDLGNENSNCGIPGDRSEGRRWLHRVSNAIRKVDDAAMITVGLHMEDLEQDRNLGPAEAGEVCDFLTMHGYPIYAAWAESDTDEHVLPFLAHVTRWLGGGSDVLFSEFGVPTIHGRNPTESGGGGLPLIEEQAAAAYIQRALEVLHEAACMGAMIWCYTDYPEELWGKAPFDEARHERFFGMWRADGSPKPSLGAIKKFSGTRRLTSSPDCTWIDIGPDEFYSEPLVQLQRLYRRYRDPGRL